MMGIFKGRFIAKSEEGKNTKTGFGIGNGATNSGPNDNAITRHCPIAYYKNDAIVLVTAGVSVQNIVEGSRNAGLWLTVLTSTTDFANYGLSRSGVSPILDATDLPDRFAIKIYDVDAGGELTTLRHNYKAAVDLGTSIQANANPLIISMDAQASNVQSLNMVFDESNASIFMPVEDSTYEVHISGDFDRAEPLDWRALMRDWIDYPSDLTGGNSMIADQRIGQLYPELRSAHAAAWAAAQFTDFDDFYADVSANKGAIAGGVVGWDQAGAAYYTRVYRVLNENGSTQSEDGGFTSLGGLSHGWGLYASAVGMSSEQFIYVNSNLLTARDIDFRDGKSEWTAYNDISDIPGGDLVANALVYVVAGTIIEGNVLLQDTVFAVNNGQVEVGGDISTNLIRISVSNAADLINEDGSLYSNDQHKITIVRNGQSVATDAPIDNITITAGALSFDANAACDVGDVVDLKIERSVGSESTWRQITVKGITVQAQS